MHEDLCNTLNHLLKEENMRESYAFGRTLEEDLLHLIDRVFTGTQSDSLQRVMSKVQRFIDDPSAYNDIQDDTMERAPNAYELLSTSSDPSRYARQQQPTTNERILTEAE
jgi:hypothetical protein